MSGKTGDGKDKLVEAYQAAPGGLSQGSALIIEDLDLSGMGMYSDKQKQDLMDNGVAEGDFFLKTLMGTTMWARWSDEGKKWHVYDDKKIVLQKELAAHPVKGKKDWRPGD